MSVSGVVAGLRAAGWLPDNVGGDGPEAGSLAGNSPRGNLLEWLERLGRSRIASGAMDSRHRRCKRLADWAARRRAAGAWLSQGVPERDLSREGELAWSCLPSCLLFWLHAVPVGPWIGIVSSRLGRRLDQRGAWFAMFRAACAVVQARQAALLTSAGTTTTRFTQFAPQHFGLRSLLVRSPRTGETLEKWLSRVFSSRCNADFSAAPEVWISPVTDLTADLSAGPISPSEWPVTSMRDEAVVALADELYVVHVRRGGNIDRLVRARLQAGPGTSRVFLASDPWLVDPHLFRELVELGAAAWEPNHAIHFDSPAGLPPERVARPGPAHSAAPILRSSPQFVWPYLTHCTREPGGPWPDESERDYLAELLSENGPAARSAGAALRRIITQRRIVATNRGIRGGVRVVCFTAMPVRELSVRRIFRPHRGRWDFEPYGICVRRDWLEQRGAGEVIYGDDRVWTELDPARRPFYQRRTSGGNGKRICDWTVELEWRHVGDVELNSLPPDAALVFVPSEDDALALARLSPWPILVISQHGE